MRYGICACCCRVLYIKMYWQFYASQNSKKSSGSHTYIHSNCPAKRIYGIANHVLMGAIIPALMHRIPSELCSQAGLGDSSTRMGDLPGSPRVAPLFLIFFCPKRVSSLKPLKI